RGVRGAMRDARGAGCDARCAMRGVRGANYEPRTTNHKLRTANFPMPDVLILMGSDSDAPVMQTAVDVLKEFGITSEMTVASAHRSPARVMRLVDEAPGRGVQIFIVGAGAAAHLGG